MDNKYLVINGGSSSLKFSLYNTIKEEIVNGYIQKIGLEDSFYTLKYDGKKIEKTCEINNHVDACNVMINELLDNGFIFNINQIAGVGHRVLHGAEFYNESVIIDDEVINNLKSLVDLGGLHLPGEISVIECMKNILPDVKQVAVFDTAFHQTMKNDRYIYPIKYEYYEKYGVRKYGFHGTSYNYINNVMKDKLGVNNPNLIVCHIGSGASMCAIKNGECVDTTMGLTPLDGLMMGTRSGSIDPAIIDYLVNKTGKNVSTITDELNKESGMVGLCGKSDLRDVDILINNGDKKAILAMKIYINSIIKYIAEYYFLLKGDVDAIVFTAGVGENNSYVRREVVNYISDVIGSKLDDDMNNQIAGFKEIKEGIITTSDSKCPIYVVPTDEESMILTDTIRLCETNKKLVKKRN